MASGPDHYREAERLLAMSSTPATAAIAQVYATLALAAAIESTRVDEPTPPLRRRWSWRVAR